MGPFLSDSVVRTDGMGETTFPYISVCVRIIVPDCPSPSLENLVKTTAFGMVLRETQT